MQPISTTEPRSKRRTALLLHIVSLFLIGLALTHPPDDSDMWWHLRAGQVMWTEQRILLTDIFSYTRLGAAWANAFWLSDLLLYLSFAIGKFFALSALPPLIGALAFSIILRRLTGNSFVNAFLLLLAAITAAPIWGPRPQILSFLLVAVLDRWLDSFPRRKWMLPFLFTLWANLHGGWIWGFLLLIAHEAGLLAQSLFAPAHEKNLLRQKTLQLLGWTALSALAIGLNPNGLAIWALPFQQVDVSLQIQEWLSPDFHRADFHPMLWMLFLLLLAAPFAPKPLNYPQLFKSLGFAYLTFVAQRNIALFAITALPLLSEWLHSFLQAIPLRSHLATSRELPPRLASTLNAMFILLLGLTVLGNLYLVSQPKRVQENYPVGAVAWLLSHQPKGRLFNSYNWGGYLIWSLPEYPVFIDGRADLYGDELIQQWHNVVNANDNALSLLDSWQVNVVFLEPRWPIIQVLEAHGWNLVFQDNQAVILTR